MWFRGTGMTSVSSSFFKNVAYNRLKSGEMCATVRGPAPWPSRLDVGGCRGSVGCHDCVGQTIENDT